MRHYTSEVLRAEKPVLSRQNNTVELTACCAASFGDHGFSVGSLDRFGGLAGVINFRSWAIKCFWGASICGRAAIAGGVVEKTAENCQFLCNCFAVGGLNINGELYRLL